MTSPRSPKLARGFELQKELSEWIKENSPTPRYDTSHEVVGGSRARYEWRAKPGTLPNPTRGALLLGDIVQNWRAALDHQIWAMTPRSVQASQGDRVSFPIHLEELKYQKWVSKWGKYYGENVLKAIEAHQPCRLPADQLSPLALLQRISNDDKHRTVNVVSQVVQTPWAMNVEPKPPGFHLEFRDGPVRGGAVLAHIEWDQGPETRQFTATTSFAFEYRLNMTDPVTGKEKWLLLEELVEDVGKSVTTVVEALRDGYVKDRMKLGNLGVGESPR